MTVLYELDGVGVVRGGRSVIGDATFTLAAGERLALVGANGAGKTTLLRTMVGLEPIAAGRLVAFGAARRVEADFREVRKSAGFLFQDPDDQLFSPTVVEDVAFGPLNLGLSQEAARQRAEATLDRLGLAHLTNRITHRLSGGEKRLVALAGVLAMEPKVLLLDEPTNALDETHLARLTEILLSLEVAQVIVSHDRYFLERLATRAVILKDGRVRPAAIHRHPHLHDHVHFHVLDEAHGHSHGDDQDATHGD